MPSFCLSVTGVDRPILWVHYEENRDIRRKSGCCSRCYRLKELLIWSICAVWFFLSLGFKQYFARTNWRTKEKRKFLLSHVDNCSELRLIRIWLVILIDRARANTLLHNQCYWRPSVGHGAIPFSGGVLQEERGANSTTESKSFTSLPSVVAVIATRSCSRSKRKTC